MAKKKPGKRKSKTKVLTKEIAETFLADNSVYLFEFTAIENEAAESIGKYKGDLDLDGLTELSDAAAESLSKSGGDLFLDGLTELSDAAAESLSKSGGILSLQGLTKLSDAAAESLCEPLLGLELDNLPASAAKILRVDGNVLINDSKKFH